MLAFTIMNNSSDKIDTLTKIANYMTSRRDAQGSVFMVPCSGFLSEVKTAAYFARGYTYFGIDGRASTDVWTAVERTSITELFTGGQYIQDCVIRLA